jgi:Flp pilus assembly protein TadG
MSKELRIREHGDRGAAAVEFALILPVLLLLVLGISQFGITFYQWLEMEHAAREGARWGSIGYAAGTTGNALTIRGKVYAAAPGLSPRLADANVAVSPADPVNHQGDPVIVTVTYDTPVLPLMGTIFGVTGPTLQLSARAVHLIE